MTVSVDGELSRDGEEKRCGDVWARRESTLLFPGLDCLCANSDFCIPDLFLMSRSLSDPISSSEDAWKVCVGELALLLSAR